MQKLGKIKNLSNTGHQKKTLKCLAGFKEKIRFFKLFFKKVIINNCLILEFSIATQLSTNSLFARNQFSFLDEQKNRRTDVSSDKNRWNG